MIGEVSLDGLDGIRPGVEVSRLHLISSTGHTLCSLHFSHLDQSFDFRACVLGSNA